MKLKIAMTMALALMTMGCTTRNLVEYKKLEKWDGKLPQVSGSNGGILLNLK